MRNRYIFILLLILTGLFTEEVSAQDPQFSQFYANQVLLNPAFAGAAQGPRLAMNYRRQWAAIPGSFKTFAAAFDTPWEIGNSNHGVGLVAMTDQAGEGNLTKLTALLAYSFQWTLDKNNIVRLGISGGIQQSSIDLLKLRFPDQIDPTTGFVDANGVPNFTNETFNNLKPSRITEDVSAGFVYYNKYAFVGVTGDHITQPQQTFIDPAAPDARLPFKLSVYAGLDIPLDRDEIKSFMPTLLFKRQGAFTQIDAGFYFNTDPVVFGLWYRGLRNPDAVVALVGLKKGMLSVGYSYDYTISSLTNRISGGSHEVAIIIEFEKGKKKRKHQKYPCPRF